MSKRSQGGALAAYANINQEPRRFGGKTVGSRTQPHKCQTSQAIWNQLMSALGISRTIPKTTAQAGAVATTIRKRWMTNNGHQLKLAHQMLPTACNELRRLRMDDCPCFPIACVLVKKLVRSAKTLDRHPEFTEIQESLKAAITPTDQKEPSAAATVVKSKKGNQRTTATLKKAKGKTPRRRAATA